jgi:hypothetical protein
MFVCSDTDFCRSRVAAGHVGRLGTAQAAPPPQPSPTRGEGATSVTRPSPPPRGEGLGVGGPLPKTEAAE